MQIPFENSVPGTFALALDLQIVDQASLELSPCGADIVADLDSSEHASRHIRSGVRQDFLTLFSGEHEHPAGLLAQMREIKQVALSSARANHAYLMGGASHPWTHDESRENTQFFGARVQVGVSSADNAIRLAQGLSLFVPHMVALSASSPLFLGEASDQMEGAQKTGLSRWSSMPRSLQNWDDFEAYMEKRQLTDAEQLHWDVVPCPAQGTVEVRQLDAALSIERACSLAGWIQVLSEWVLRQDTLAWPSAVDQAVNRYQATLFGLQATYIGADGRRTYLRQDLLELMDKLAPVADEIGSLAELKSLEQQVVTSNTDAQWMRQQWSLTACRERLIKAMVNRFEVHQYREALSDIKV